MDRGECHLRVARGPRLAHRERSADRRKDCHRAAMYVARARPTGSDLAARSRAQRRGGEQTTMRRSVRCVRGVREDGLMELPQCRTASSNPGRRSSCSTLDEQYDMKSTTRPVAPVATLPLSHAAARVPHTVGTAFDGCPDRCRKGGPLLDAGGQPSASPLPLPPPQAESACGRPIPWSSPCGTSPANARGGDDHAKTAARRRGGCRRRSHRDICSHCRSQRRSGLLGLFSGAPVDQPSEDSATDQPLAFLLVFFVEDRVGIAVPFDDVVDEKDGARILRTRSPPRSTSCQACGTASLEKTSSWCRMRPGRPPTA